MCWMIPAAAASTKVGAGTSVVVVGDPRHDAEATDEVHARSFQPVVREVDEVLSELCEPP